MAFRLTVEESPELTTLSLAGRVGDDAVTPLLDACGRARRPVALDLSEVTGASEAGVLALRRLTGKGVRLLGASRYLALLLADEPTVAPARPRGQSSRKAPGRAAGTPRRRRTPQA